MSVALLALLGALSCAGWSAPPAGRAEPAAAVPPRTEPADLPGVILHTVRPRETLWRIARAYGAELEEVIVVNNLDESARITAGQTLVIPGPHRLPPPGPLLPESERAGVREPEADDVRSREGARRGTGSVEPALRWPLRGAIQSRFGPRGRRHHDGIDIDGRMGDAIRAAADGRVVFSGNRGAYGKTIILEHDDGLRTLYAHAEKIKVRRGERVREGQTIALVGRTGNAHGTHLHFEVWVDERPVDPLEHLPYASARAGAGR